MKWISCTKRLPESSDEEVLVYAPNCDIIGHKLIGRCFLDNDGKGTVAWTVYDFSESKLDELVTHWMPLPESPKQNE